MTIKAFLSGFRDDQRGSMSVELIFVAPIIVWVVLSTFIYFDAFRTQANTNRAALTIADMFSREQVSVDDNYILGAQQLLRALTFSDNDPDIRVTVYSFDEPNDEYIAKWSETKGLGDPLDTVDLALMRTNGVLPILANEDNAILVETRTNYSAPFSPGLWFMSGTDLQDQTFDTFVVIRPRFNDTLCFDSSPGDGIPDNDVVC